ncbi:MAG: phosphoribosylanthranilate isomerase [Candidatus Latescibacterota bacterium]|nr:MAG: phosphoribosylanthranilate isomerase [Candidatus Latescibacterota bacterium]
MLADCGVDFIGFPLRLPNGREDLSETDAKAIISGLKPPARGVVITYLDDADSISSFCREIGTTIVQLHGDIRPGELERLRELDPHIGIVKSLIVREDNLARLKSVVDRTSDFVNAYITDTFDPVTGTCGATGKTHDWSISRKIVEYSTRPVILAGGLRPENVHDAILVVRPAGVDSHTGVEGSDGRKSRVLVERFLAESRAAFEAVRKT